MKLLLLFIYFSLLSSMSFAESRNNRLSGELEILGSRNTNIRNIDEMRDPFKRPVVRTRRREIRTEPRTSFVRNVPTIEGVPLNLIRIVGILLGEERRAIAKISNRPLSAFEDMDGDDEVLSEEGYVLKEGMRIGENRAEIKAILPGGIVLVERIRNIYDQDEYLETIIPLTLQ